MRTATPDGRPDPIFVIGVPRSGTTLLHVLLDNHPRIYAGRSGRAAYAASLAAEFTERGLFDLHIDMEGLLRRFLLEGRDRFPRVLGDFFGLVEGDSEFLGDADLQSVLRECTVREASISGCDLWADKVVGHPERCLRMSKVFGRARIIHIIRDGRAVASSLRQRQLMDLKLASALWLDEVSRMRAMWQIYDPVFYHEVRYEDLITDPEMTLRNICRFIRVDYDPAMTQISRHPDTEQGGAYVLRRFDESKIHSWKEKVSDKEWRTMESVMSRLLSSLEYPIRFETKPAADRRHRLEMFLHAHGQAFKRFTVSDVQVMKQRELVTVHRSFRNRLRKLISTIARLWFSDSVVGLFRSNATSRSGRSIETKEAARTRRPEPVD